MATKNQLEALHELAENWVQTRNPWAYVFGSNVLEAIEKSPRKTVRQIVAQAKRGAKEDMDKSAATFMDEWPEWWAEGFGE